MPAERGRRPVGLSVEDRPLIHEASKLSETKKYRKLTAAQETEIVLASLH